MLYCTVFKNQFHYFLQQSKTKHMLPSILLQLSAWHHDVISLLTIKTTYSSALNKKQVGSTRPYGSPTVDSYFGERAWFYSWFCACVLRACVCKIQQKISDVTTENFCNNAIIWMFAIRYFGRRMGDQISELFVVLHQVPSVLSLKILLFDPNIIQGGRWRIESSRVRNTNTCDSAGHLKKTLFASGAKRSRRRRGWFWFW